MESGKDSDVVWVRVPSGCKEKLGAVARQLHCTPAEAALFAIRNQLEKMDLSSLLRRRFSESGSPVPSPEKRESTKEFP
ncbi:MAG: hypothetical protein IJS32_10540 [Kiritimatiellae bacterium]|nr:hypothetical protein [Kiritimatiellia bacterium]